MWTVLSTTHISTHAMYCCYSLYPCGQCCPLHTYQHMLCIVAIHCTHVDSVVHYTHINTCYVFLLFTVPMWTVLYTTHISTHAMYCCYSLYPCGQCCLLHTYQHMLCIVVIDCTHVDSVVHYTHINTCYVLLLFTVSMWTVLSTTHISTHAMYCCYSLYPCGQCCPLKNNQHTVYLVDIVDHTHSGSVLASIEDMVTLHRRTLQQIFR